MKEKVYGKKIRHFKPLDITEANPFEMLFYHFFGHFFPDYRIKFGLPCDQADIAGIAFIT